MSAIWVAITAFGALLADLFITKGEKDKLADKLAAGRYENEDSNLEAKQATLQKTISAEQKTIDDSKAPNTVPDLTTQQAANYWNNKK